MRPSGRLWREEKKCQQLIWSGRVETICVELRPLLNTSRQKPAMSAPEFSRNLWQEGGDATDSRVAKASV